jgi:hypothetical protein
MNAADAGVFHLHRVLAYVVFFLALVNVFLLLSPARNSPRVAAWVGGIARFGVVMGGRAIAVTGVLLWLRLPQHGLGAVWLWASLLLWLPVEALGRARVLPEVEAVRLGSPPSWRLFGGVVGQLLCIAAVFGLMSARP